MVKYHMPLTTTKFYSTNTIFCCPNETVFLVWIIQSYRIFLEKKIPFNLHNNFVEIQGKFKGNSIDIPDNIPSISVLIYWIKSI